MAGIGLFLVGSLEILKQDFVNRGIVR